jgi:hypothetical protein
MSGIYDLKLRELNQKKEELKSLDPNSPKYMYVKEQIDYLLADLYEFQKEKWVYPTTG